MDNQNNATSITIPAKPEYVSIARLITAAFAGFFGFDSETLEDIKIAVSEACTSAILQLHKEARLADRMVRISVYPERGELVIDVEHATLDAATALKQTKAQLGEKDLGMDLLTSIMDRVEVLKARDHDVILRLAKRIPS